VGPQPYLIDPSDYLKLICCLVEKRYVPAHEALIKSETDHANVAERIKINNEQFKDWVKTLESAAKAVIPSVIDCCEYERDDQQH
jgi:hypothetical protein